MGKGLVEEQSRVTGGNAEKGDSGVGGGADHSPHTMVSEGWSAKLSSN